MNKILILIFILISTAFSQSNFLLFFDGSEAAYAGGAKGDGVTDDYLALQTWINNNSTLDLSTASGKTFLISQPLYPRSNTTWLLHPTTTIKLVPGDSSMLTADYHKDLNYCVVAEPEKFAVGQWVGIIDDTQAFSSGNLLRYGWTDSITAIGHDTLYLKHTINIDTIKVSQNGRAGHVQSVIIADGIENWTLNGGIIDANGFSTNQIKVHPVYTYGGNGENLNAGTGISVMGGKNLIIKNVSVINGVTHNIVSASRWGLGVINTEDVLFDNIKLNKARMKNLWIRETKRPTINVAHCDSAIREDAIVAYTNVSQMTVDSAFITNWGRHGFLFNGNSGGVCDSLNATNIFLSSPLNNSSSAITLKGSRAWVNGFTITGGTANRNRVAVTNQYGGTRDINLLNGTLTNITDTAVISIKGDVGRVNFNNVTLNNCTGIAVYVDTFATATPNLTYDGFPDTITFTGGGIYNHTGYNFKYAQSVIADSTRFIFSNFFASPAIYNLSATATNTGVGRVGYVNLAWSDSVALSEYYVYANSNLIDSTTAKTYQDTITTGIHSYQIRGRDASYNYTALSSASVDTVYEFEVPRYLACTTNAIDDTNKQRINNFVKARKDSLGIDSLAQAYDLLYLFANTDSVLSKINLVKGNIGTFNCVVMDTLTWSIRKGWNGDVTGGNNYLNTKYSCYTDSVNFARHNFGIGIYVQQSTGYSGVDFGAGASTGNDVRGRVRNTSDQYYYKMVDIGGASPSTSSNAAGWTTFERESTTRTGIYKNGIASVPMGTGNTVSYASNITQHFYIGCYNANGTASFFTPRIYSAFAVRRNFSASENSAEKTDIEAYLDALGTGVIP